MLVVVPFYNGDRDLAIKWADWTNSLGPYPNHSMLIARDHRAEPIPQMGQGFGKVEELEIKDDIWNKWPESPNHVFSKVARYIEYIIKEPWLWCEVDAWPLSEGWLDAIGNEYKACQKPFMGARVDVTGVPVHMSGVAVYPAIMTDYAGEALMATDTAWDVSASRQIVPKMHETGLIAHSWDRELDAKLRNRKARFENYQAVVREVFVPHPEAVIYHADKTLSLVNLLRQARGRGDVKCTRGQTTKQSQARTSPPAPSVQSTEAAGIDTTPYTTEWLLINIAERFTDPLAKARIMKKLKSYPVKK